MNKQRTARIALVVLALGFYHADAASAQDAPAAADEALIEPIKTEHQYDLTEAGKHIAVERVKTVLSPKRKRYISIDRVPDEGRSDLRVTAFHERDADGTLRKYARKEKVRKGKGIRAFRRGVGIRIVGLNQKLEPVEIPKASEHQVWDPGFLAGLALWLEQGSKTTEVSFKALDMSSRVSQTARLQPAEGLTVGGADGQAVTLTCWKAWSGGAEIATACVEQEGVMVAVKAGKRALLMQGWTWQVPPPPEPEVAQPPTESGAAVAPAPEDGPEIGP